MEVNPNSSLYDFADDNAAFLNNPVLVSELINIRDNYENMDLGALKEAYSRLTTDLASLSGAGELEKEVRAQISLQQGTLFDANNTGAVTNDTSYDNTQESIKETSTTSVNSNLSDYKDFAPPSDTSKADTNEVLYNLNDDKQKAFYEEEINKTNTTISEAEFNSRFTGNELNQNITDASIANISSTTFNNAAMEAANVGFNNLKKMEGAMTPEEKKQRTQTLIEELKDTIGFKEGVDPNLLFLKFGIDVLNARTTKKKPLPQVFDLFAQALAPTANFYFQEAAKKKQDLKELGLTAFSLVKEEDDRAKRMYQPTGNLTAVQLIDYNDEGTITGQLDFFKNSSVPAEIEFYSNLKYPKTIGGVPVPENLVGKNMFTITAPGMATDQPRSSGILGGDDKAIAQKEEETKFLEQGLNAVLTAHDIGRLNEMHNKAVFGSVYEANMFMKTLRGIIGDYTGEVANILGFSDFDSSKINENMSTLEKQITTVNQLGYNINEQAIVNDIDGSFKNIVQTINASDMTSADKQEALSNVTSYYTDVKQNILDKNLDLINILEAQSTFAFARYLQGSNRLLKDVIAESRKVVQLGGLNNNHRKTMNRLEGLINFYVNNYNATIRPFHNTDDFEKFKKTVVIGKDGKITVVGGEYGGVQEGAAFGTIQNGVQTNQGTLDYLDDKMGENFTKDFNLR